MRRLILALLVAACEPGAAVPWDRGGSATAGDTDTDTDADGDSDADGDGDTDTDADADGDADTDADSDADGDADGDADQDADSDVDTCEPPDCSFPECWAYTCDPAVCPPSPFLLDLSDVCGPDLGCDPPSSPLTGGSAIWMILLPAKEDVNCPDAECEYWDLVPPVQAQLHGTNTTGISTRMAVQGNGTGRVVLYDDGNHCGNAWGLGETCQRFGGSNGWRVLAAEGAPVAWLRVDRCAWDDPDCEVPECE